jgi:hypothetical protein
MAKTNDPNVLSELAVGLSTVAARLESKEAAQLCSKAAATLTQAMAKSTSVFAPNVPATGLTTIIARVDSHELWRRSAGLAAIAGPLASGYPAAVLPSLRSTLEPLPCRLSTQELVEILKQPTCIGPARRVILDQLENRYRHPFIDHWAFVRFAQEHHLGLDFTSPPKRLAP